MGLFCIVVDMFDNLLKKVSEGAKQAFQKVTGKGMSNEYRAYFDYASLTPIDKRVVKAMHQASQCFPANPSSIYREGVEAKKALEGARVDIARMLEVHADEIIFTSGGTESNNL